MAQHPSTTGVPDSITIDPYPAARHHTGSDVLRKENKNKYYSKNENHTALLAAALFGNHNPQLRQ